MQTIPVTQLRLPSRLLDTVLDKETELDGSLPEYCPDITRLIRVDCTPYVDGCEIGSDKLHINGRVLYDVLYETDRKNKLRHCSFTQEFQHTCDLPRNGLDALRGDCEASCTRITCKMLSPRRLVLQARLELHVTVGGELAVHMLSADPTEGMFFKTKLLSYELPVRKLMQEARFEEALPLLQGEKSISEVICGSVSLQPAQLTVTPGCASAKANALVKLLYEAEDENDGYCMSAKTIPVTVTLEDASISEGNPCSVSLTVSDSNILPELDQYGESRLVKASFGVRAVLKLHESTRVSVAEDLFSVTHEDTTAKTEVTIPRLASETDRSFTVDLKLQTEELSFSSLYDTTVRAGRIRTTPVDGGVELAGALTVSILGNGNDGMQHRDFTEEFIQFVPAELPAELSQTEAEVCPFEVLPTLHADGSISARVICNAHLSLYTQEHVSFLSEITKQTELPPEDEPYTLAYLFPTKEDDLWSVAKQYRIDPERIRSENPGAFDESGRVFPDRKAILIKKA